MSHERRKKMFKIVNTLQPLVRNQVDYMYEILSYFTTKLILSHVVSGTMKESISVRVQTKNDQCTCLHACVRVRLCLLRSIEALDRIHPLSQIDHAATTHKCQSGTTQPRSCVAIPRRHMPSAVAVVIARTWSQASLYPRDWLSQQLNTQYFFLQVAKYTIL